MSGERESETKIEYFVGRERERESETNIEYYVEREREKNKDRILCRERERE